jgi:D-cysteine desulfhydrase
LDTNQSQAESFPLFDAFPALASVPRAKLCTLPSPVQRLQDVAPDLWIKRDDLNAPECGGNKVRALEFLLGDLEEGDTVVTVGGEGSTHVLSTAIHARRLGLRVLALRWTHEMNSVADLASERIHDLLPGSRVHGNPVIALASARFHAMGSRVRYIPLGGSSPLGILGHVNAALELAGQIQHNEMPMPWRMVLPVASGGTAAGLLLGFTIAGMPIDIVGARVGPGLFVNRAKVLGLVRRTRKLTEEITGTRLPRVDSSRLYIVHDTYGGAYGRALPRAAAAAKVLHDAAGISLDETYSAKAWAAVLDERARMGGALLYWLTFDAKCLTT